MNASEENCAATQPEDFVRRFIEDLRDPLTALQTHERGPCGSSSNWGDASKAAILARLLSAESNEAELTSLRSQNKEMREALTDARDAISTLPESSLGYAGVDLGDFSDPQEWSWPIRDELLNKIKAALSPTSKEETA